MKTFNANKAGLFEGGFVWGGVQFDLLTPSMFQEELIQCQYNLYHCTIVKQPI